MYMQRVGGIASIANVILIVIFFIVVVVVFPRLGVGTLSDLTDPIKGISAWNSSPITFSLYQMLNIFIGIACLLTILALRERMQMSAPTLMRIAVIGASIACAMWISAGIITMGAKASIISNNDTSAFRAVLTVFFGLSFTGDHAFGWALVLTGLAALKNRKLSRILSYFTILEGVLLIPYCISEIFGAVGWTLLIIWALWLGIVLLRSKVSV